jgi:hypothetical protein
VGLVRALVVLLVLAWTNPLLNADGTPCMDLSFIRLHIRHEASGQTYDVDYPLWWTDPDTGEVLWRSHEGLADSVSMFTLPHSTRDYDWWWVTAFAVDFNGNASDSSNTVSVTAPTD